MEKKSNSLIVRECHDERETTLEQMMQRPPLDWTELKIALELIRQAAKRGVPIDFRDLDLDLRVYQEKAAESKQASLTLASLVLQQV